MTQQEQQIYRNNKFASIPIPSNCRDILCLLVFLSTINCYINCNQASESAPNAIKASQHLDEDVSFDPASNIQLSHLSGSSSNSDLGPGSSSGPPAFLDPFAETFEEYLRDHEASSLSQTSIELADQAVTTSSSVDIGQGNHEGVASQSTNSESRIDPHTNAIDSIVSQLFAWKQLPTNKCSRPCGRGFRMNHISCVDRKYDVRVEDEICALKLRNSIKPSEYSDEPCNEFDCPPNWQLSIDQHHSNLSQLDCYNHATGNSDQVSLGCECWQVNASGQHVKVDPTKCQQQSISLTSPNKSIPAYKTTTTTTTTTTIAPTHQQALQQHEELVRFEPDDQLVSLDDINLNNILQQTAEDYRHHRDQHQSKLPAANEPFYEPQAWGECKSADGCGHLGIRRRELLCRMYLSKSSKYVDISSESCDNAATINKPETEEPCYVDCSIIDQRSLNQTSESGRSHQTELADETIYDLEMTRYEWRHEGWTKCNADCLGGERESLIECWDKVLATPVEVSLCESELKPQVIVEKCNQHPCPFEWRYETYSHQCSRECGSDGVKPRHLYCVQKTALNARYGYDSTSSGSVIDLKRHHYHYVRRPVALCYQSKEAGPEPAQLEACNRFDCPPEWVNGPWSDCDTKCGPGTRYRNVTCVQELATLGSGSGSSTIEKIQQVPFEKCYSEYKMIPSLEERCYGTCIDQLFIDSAKDQNYNFLSEVRSDELSNGRKSVSLRVGGRAQLIEGINLKLRCKIMKRTAQTGSPLVKRVSVPIEWKFNGQDIFPNGSTMSDKRLINNSPDQMDTSSQDTQSNENDILIYGRHTAMQADEAKPTSGSRKNQHKTRILRNLSARSWLHQESFDPSSNRWQFIGGDRDGRFSISRENTLKIKRLRKDDSGIYSCSHGNLSESMELYVYNGSDEQHSANSKFGTGAGNGIVSTSQDKARAENELI